jgi:transposase
MMEGKSKRSRFQLRLELVRYAQRQGLREAARVFRCSRNTVRLWVRRYEAEGFSGLKERIRAPHRIPHKTSLYLENKVLEARKGHDD